MTKYAILQLSYVKIPFLFTSEVDLIDRIIRDAGKVIDYIAEQYGYERVSVSSPIRNLGLLCPGTLPCVLLWFRKESWASTVLPIREIVEALKPLALGIMIFSATQLEYDDKTGEKQLVTTVTMSYGDMYEMCVNQGASYEVCRTIVDNVTQGRSTEFSILQIYYVPIPYIFPGEDEVINRINGAGDLINNVSLQFGYGFAGAYPATEAAPCQGPLPTPCINLWFLKKGSPALPIVPIIAAITILGLGIIIYFIKLLDYEMEKNRTEQLETMLRTAQEMYESCTEQGGSPQDCSQIVSNIVQGTKISPSPVEEFGNLVRTIGILVAVGIGGFILIEVLRMWRRR